MYASGRPVRGPRRHPALDASRTSRLGAATARAPPSDWQRRPSYWSHRRRHRAGERQDPKTVPRCPSSRRRSERRSDPRASRSRRRPNGRADQPVQGTPALRGGRCPRILRARGPGRSPAGAVERRARRSASWRWSGRAVAGSHPRSRRAGPGPPPRAARRIGKWFIAEMSRGAARSRSGGRAVRIAAEPSPGLFKILESGLADSSRRWTASLEARGAHPDRRPVRGGVHADRGRDRAPVPREPSRGRRRPLRRVRVVSDAPGRLLRPPAHLSAVRRAAGNQYRGRDPAHAR